MIDGSGMHVLHLGMQMRSGKKLPFEICNVSSDAQLGFSSVLGLFYCVL